VSGKTILGVRFFRFYTGRDHAGVGNYYGMFEAQDIFDGLKPGELLIKPLKMDWTFWCYKCDSMASMRTCPHDKDDRLLISGTRLREMLSKNEDVPDKFSRIEVLEILREYYSKE
jgi:sulfate adenylyltransferase